MGVVEILLPFFNNKNTMKNVTIKDFLAIFVVIFGTVAIVIADLKDIVLGALIGFIGAILQYFFGSSTGSASKDKIIQDMNDKKIEEKSTPLNEEQKEKFNKMDENVENIDLNIENIKSDAEEIKSAFVKKENND